jgi:putative Mg2+ transporter-C (MgtC) family protein
MAYLSPLIPELKPSALLRPGDPELLLRLAVATMAGGAIGWNRFRAGKPAGIGTHALVALGAALFTAIPLQQGLPGQEGWSRVVQGIATGIGFIGAGEIFRDPHRNRTVHGLTSAAALWVTAALGVLAGCGSALVVAGATVLTLLAMVAAPHLERRDQEPPDRPSGA